MRDPQWLTYARSYVPSWRREVSGQIIQPVGAHAFLGETARSVCNNVSREKAGGPAVPGARRCINCEQKLQRITKRIAEQTRHDVAASVARHAALEGKESAEVTKHESDASPAEMESVVGRLLDDCALEIEDEIENNSGEP